MRALLPRLFPFLAWWPRVDGATLRADAFAGLAGALIVLPQAVAFATIAGLPPQYGLYAAMVPAIVAALFGSSWHMVSGPTTAISLVVFATVSPHAPAGSEHYLRDVLTLSLLVGALQFSMGLLRLGVLVDFISHSVLVGFTAGAAVLIGGSQLKNLLGISLPARPDFFPMLRDLALHLGEANPWSLATGGLTLALAVGLRRFFPKIPYLIVAMVGGGAFAYFLQRHLGSGAAVRTVGALPASLPPLSMPDLSWTTLRDLAPAAMAIGLVALTEAVGIARGIALKSGQRIDGNREFLGQGLSNMAGAFFSAYPSSGSFNRSGLNFDGGAKTPLASVFAALFLVGVVLVVAPLAAWLPMASMAGVLLLIAWRLVDREQIRHILSSGKGEAAVLLLTFSATLLLALEFAILAGVLLSLFLYLHRASRVHLRVLAPDPAHPHRRFSDAPPLAICPQLLMVRVEGSLFFGAANHVASQFDQLRGAHPGARHLLLLAKSMNQVDLTGAAVIAEESRIRRAAGGGIYFYGLRDAAKASLEKAGALSDLVSRCYDNRGEAIASIFKERLDPRRCETCASRIFLECDRVLRH
ncbi:MAG: SulP family inorganic anion transporter [Spirochaetes bacterium]|nr:SulP family inorganic anion transporter [Spirochaetota bacterium]